MTQEVLHEAASTRERVRGAALELFGEKGYDGASMNEIAERVGIAKPSLYNYYRSKEELLLDLVEEGMRQWDEACMPPFESDESFERQLARHLALTVRFAVDRPHIVALFQLATSHVQGELAERVQELVAGLEASIRERVHVRIAAAV
ncbi:MAG TPA: helix-turn-helix domain-containing protein, partial [Thermoanaerobaculia bacterium]|nr:helix-turn-helix domain-containing protein [Thermoanaerobaculia bacterium]